MNRATVIVDVEEGEEVEITVLRRRVERTPGGPGLARAVIETVGETVEVIDLAAERTRRSA